MTAQVLEANRPTAADDRDKRRDLTDQAPDGEAAALDPRSCSVMLDQAGPAYVADIEGNIVYANQPFRAVREMLEAGGHDAHGRPTIPLRTIITDVARDRKRLTSENDIHAEDAERHLVGRHFPIRNGKRKTVAVGGIYFDHSGERQALRRAEETRSRLNDIVRSISDWVWETDSNINLTFVSDRICETVGLRPHLLKGKPLLELGTFSEPPQGAMAGEHLIGNRLPFRDLYFVVPCPAGDRLHRLAGVPIFEQGSERFAGYRGTGVDVTEQEAAERENRRTRSELESALEELVNKNHQLDVALTDAKTAADAKQRFLMMMSHELRTPLNAVIGFAEIAAQEKLGPVPEAYRDFMQEIVGGGRHLLALINDLLDVARVEENQVDVRHEPVDLGQLLKEAVSLIALRAREKGVAVDEADAGEGITVMADPLRARQVFVNLLSNAVKFTASGGAIGLDVAIDGNMVDVAVWDSGIGIPSDKLQLIFEAFEQVHDGVLARGQEGSGLGLAVTRHLVELMGGEIGVESEPGEGSRFSVRLQAGD